MRCSRMSELAEEEGRSFDKFFVSLCIRNAVMSCKSTKEETVGQWIDATEPRLRTSDELSSCDLHSFTR